MSGTGASSAGAGSEDEIRLRVETISGQVIQLTVPKHETIFNVKNRIFNKQGIPVAEQNLMFLDEELKDSYTLEDYNIIDSCTIRLSIGMKGGPMNTRRTLYLDDKNTIHEMAKMLAAHDISVVLVPHNGAYHVIPVTSDKRDGAHSSGERRSRHSVAKLMEGQQHQQLQGKDGRRTEENKTTKSKMVALQKQFKKKRSAPCQSQIPAVISRSSGCWASNLQKALTNSLQPSAGAPVALVGGGGSGSESRHQRKVVVPRLITSHNIPLNELNPSQTMTQYYTTTTTATADGGGAFESSSSYSSGVERNLVIYPTAGPSGSGGASSTGGEAIFVSPYKGLFRCTADTTENASKEDVSSGSGRCSSAAAAPPPADSSPTMMERPQPVNQTQQSTSAPSADSSSSSGLSGSRGQLLSQATPPTHPPQKPTDDATSAQDEVKVDRKSEETVPELSVSADKESTVSTTTTTATPPKKKHPRCLVCNKKTGLASSYTCRCGGNFCATHRYAEAHNCGHDYKTEGRQQLEKNNPLIQASKLQKI